MPGSVFAPKPLGLDYANLEKQQTRGGYMDKDKSQLAHNHSLHHNITTENFSQPSAGNVTEDEMLDHEAELDALEAKLFAMAGAHR